MNAIVIRNFRALLGRSYSIGSSLRAATVCAVEQANFNLQHDGLTKEKTVADRVPVAAIIHTPAATRTRITTAARDRSIGSREAVR